MIDTNINLDKKLLWVDLEMTGIDPVECRILEIAALVTDYDFNELDRYESVIYQPPNIMSQMNEWCRETFTANGLIDRVQAAPNEQHVVAEFSEFIKTNFSQPAILAGNSIHQDRRFIRQWWPAVEQLLFYRMLDVSSYKIIMQNKYGAMYNKKEVHNAIDDINESIDELKFYLNYFSNKSRT